MRRRKERICCVCLAGKRDVAAARRGGRGSGRDHHRREQPLHMQFPRIHLSILVVLEVDILWPRWVLVVR